MMLGGTGPSARKGFVVFDSEDAIRKNIEEGITNIIPPEKRAAVISFYDDVPGKTGGIET